MEIVFATNNNHKLREIRQIFGDRINILSLSDVNCKEEIPEEQPTIEGNASQKSFYLYEKYGHNCFADDTGLEIEALNGAPGVYSARYAGEGCIPADNIKKVLHEMQGATNRKVRFKTVISLVINGEEQLFEGLVHGTILRETVGEGGFGYDPIFLPDGYSETFAQMQAEVKNKISHRGRAVQKLADYLLNLK